MASYFDDLQRSSQVFKTEVIADIYVSAISSQSIIDLLAILKKNLDRAIFHYILQNFRMCTIHKEALTPLNRASRIKMYENNARSRLFCRIAKTTPNMAWRIENLGKDKNQSSNFAFLTTTVVNLKMLTSVLTLQHML